MRRWPAILVAAALVGCAGSRRQSEPAPSSAHLAASLAWNASGAPFFAIAVSLPAADVLALVPPADASAHLVLSATATGTGGRELAGQAWTRQVDRPQLQSGADLHWCVALRTASGPQQLALTVLVQGRTLGAAWHRHFEVPVPAPDALALGEPLFLRAAASDSACNAIHVARYYDAGTGPPRLRVSIYDFAATDTAFALAYVVRGLDAPDAPVVTGSLPVRSRGRLTPVVWDLPPLPLGRYDLEVQVRGASRAAVASGRFEVGLVDLAGLGTDAGGFELLGLLLSTTAADSLRRAAPAAREALWQELWRRRDPTPGTAANEALAAALARVREANQRFGGALPGWRTDRGHVYIQRGAPDTVDTLPNAEGFDRIERWTYSRSNTVFVFVDRDGSGDFTLLRTNARDF